MLLYFNSGDFLVVLNLFEELRLILNFFEGLEFCIVVVCGRGIGGLVKIYEGVLVIDVGFFGNDGFL